MSLIIAPVSYKRLLTTISRQKNDAKQKLTSVGAVQCASMKDVYWPMVDLDNYLLDHSYEFASSKTNFLDLLDDETLLQLAYEFGLDKKSELPELQDIEMAIGDCVNNNVTSDNPCGTAAKNENNDKMVQR